MIRVSSSEVFGAGLRRVGQLLGINVKKESFLKNLVNIPSRAFTLGYEKTIPWPESGLISILVGDSDLAFSDRAKLGEWINKPHFARCACPDSYCQWPLHISPIYTSRLLRITFQNFNAFCFKIRPGL